MKSILVPPTSGFELVLDRSLKYVAYARGSNFKELIEILKTGVPLCASCQQRCGCTGCIQALPCQCTLGYCTSCFSKPCKCCHKCNRYPCSCMPPVCSQCKTYPCTHIKGYSNPWFSGNSITLTMPSNSTLTLANVAFSAPLTINTIGPINPTPQLPQPSLSTGPQFYNPSMLQRGTDNDKNARQKAIAFRNLMLGEKWKDLYSPHGFIVKSKKFPGIREYAFYSHHVSCHVFDNGINIGRLDVHVQGYSVPMGDTHIAAMIKCANDEEEFLKCSQFSPVRDI